MWYNPPMRRRFRIRRIAKWTGLVLCALVLVAWAVSSLGYVFGYRGGGVSLGSWFGSVFFGHAEHDDTTSGRFVWRRFTPVGELPVRDRLFSHWWPRWEIQETLHPRTPYEPRLANTVWVPLWILFVVLAVPTVLLWRSDRKPPPGRCQRCGYNLTGNTSGICPECGERVGGGSQLCGEDT